MKKILLSLVVLFFVACTGEVGSGPAGPQGPEGPQGIPGIAGSQGVPGPKGEIGSISPVLLGYFVGQIDANDYHGSITGTWSTGASDRKSFFIPPGIRRISHISVNLRDWIEPGNEQVTVEVMESPGFANVDQPLIKPAKYSLTTFVSGAGEIDSLTTMPWISVHATATGGYSGIVEAQVWASP